MADSLTAPKIITSLGVGTNRPGGLQVMRVHVGATAGSEVEVDATGTYEIVSVPAGIFVYTVMARIITAFTATVTINIGDGTDTDGWLATAKLAPTTAETAGIFKNTQLPTAEAFAGGKKYLTADTIDAVIGVATPSAGLMEVVIVYAPFTFGTT